MLLRQVFDPYLAQYAYLIGCQRTGEALVIDPERDVERYKALAEANDLRLTAVAETHIHADFVSGAQELAADPEMRVYVSGEGGADWTSRWAEGRPNTYILKDGDTFRVGKIVVRAVHSPGHTPEHISFLVTDEGGGANEPIALATGDFLFVGDVGRPDLLESAAGQKGVMEPSARTLQESLTGYVGTLADYVQVLPAHGAGSACGKALGAVPISTLGYERRFNGALRMASTDAETFVKEILRGQPDPPLYFATMKRVNRDGVRVTGGVPEAKHLTYEEAKELAGDPAVTILDARDSRDDFAAGHLERAVHVPLHGPFFSAGAGSFVVDDEPVLVIAPDAEAAELAAVQLYRIGLDGLKGWITPEEWAAGGGTTIPSARVQFEEFDAGAARGEGVILDVRTASEFSEGHLEGALSIPYTRLRQRLEEVPEGRKLFVHCGVGKRSSLAASFLAARGFETVHVDGVCADCERIASSQNITH
jgi:hydroxyacylglutathione hydrolase